MNRLKDNTGMRFGRLVVIERVPTVATPKGTKHSKSFSMDRYGESEALRLAVEAREAGMRASENTENAYGVNHGTDHNKSEES